MSIYDVPVWVWLLLSAWPVAVLVLVVLAAHQVREDRRARAAQSLPTRRRTDRPYTSATRSMDEGAFLPADLCDSVDDDADMLVVLDAAREREDREVAALERLLALPARQPRWTA